MSLIPMKKIVSSDKNPRTIAGVNDYINTPLSEFPLDFQAGILELAKSIEQHGLIQSIVVKDLGRGERYRLLAGHRRFKAYQYLGKTQIDAKSIKGKAEDEPTVALIENIDRVDLPPMDIARGLDAIRVAKKIEKQSTLAELVNKSQAWVSQHLALLQADETVQDALENGELSFAGARAIVALPKAEQADAIADAKKDSEDAGESKVSTKGAKRAAGRKKKEREGKQQTIRPLEEREREQRSEAVSGFLEEYWPRGEGAPEDADAIAGMFWDFLMDRERLVIRP